MQGNLDDLLRETAEEMFESLAYMFPMPSEDDEPAFAGPMVSAGVAFTGPFGGALALSIERGMLTELTGNMLGEMDAAELTEAQQADGFGELLNVVCGNLLPRLAGEQAVFDVHAPRVFGDEPIPETLDGRSVRARVELELDSGKAVAILYADADEVAAIAG